MYVTASAITDVNKLKYQLFQAKKGAMESCQLPPCAGFLYLHWPECYLLFYEEKNLEKHCNTASIKPGYGGLMDSAQFSTDWLQRPPDLELMLEFMACKCSKTCKLPSWQCLVNNFKCHLQTYETWTSMKKMLIYLEWRVWISTMKIPIQNEMLIFLGSIVSINYAYEIITCI